MLDSLKVLFLAIRNLKWLPKMWEVLKTLRKTSLFKVLEKLLLAYKLIDFLLEIPSMFGFVTKFKNEVYAGFELVKQRLVTLEAKVEALFEHTKSQASQVAEDVKTNVTNTVEAVGDKVDAVKTVAADVAKTVEDVKGD